MTKQQREGEPDTGRGPGALALLFAFALAVAAIVAVIAVAGLVAGGGEGDAVKRAVIVDQLSLTFANPDFVDGATATLEAAGYEVDYYPGEEVTVDLYRDLPSRGYDIIVLRAHSGRLREEGAITDDVVLFTGEPMVQGRYAEERRAGLVTRAFYSESDPDSDVFGVPAEFVEARSNGDLGGATVILMGCDGLRSGKMAEAFIEKGAGAFISWDDEVTPAHTDAATLHLLERLVSGLAATQAVGQTNTQVGPDPAFGAQLRVWMEGY